VSDQELNEQDLLGDITGRHSRRKFMTRAGVLGLSTATLSATSLSAALSGCGTASSSASVNLSGPIALQTLITQAKKEGGLQAVGIPPEWADYSEMLANYASQYVPVDYKADAEYSSAQEVQVFKLSKTHAYGDIADVGFIWGPTVIQEGLVSPYKHSYWNDVPAQLKDPNGNWCTEYWGAQALVVNTDIVKNPPTSFADLLTNDYPNMVGIDGDPRQATDALDAVYASALAKTGSTSSIQPGIDFFAALKKKGNFTLARANEANLVKGEVAIAIIWDYLGLGYRDKYASSGPHFTVTIPSDGSIAGPYILIVNKTAPHPYAARLWSEYLFSDAGQLIFLKGYAHPVRYQVLANQGKIPADLAAKLPPASSYTKVQFVADPALLTAAGNTLNQNWQSQVLGS
jgi:putative spermidine/putrescine transport system substrate-binding protein